MDARAKLDMQFAKQFNNPIVADRSDMEPYISVARAYAELEHQLVVLSDIARNESFVFNGKFSNILDIDTEKCKGLIPSKWEDAIFQAIHPDDLEEKMLQELLFYHYVCRLPKGNRFDQSLIQRLRMRSRRGEWIEVLHRLYYIHGEDGKSVKFALCMYGAMTMELKTNSMVMDCMTGKTTILDNATGAKILSPQERSVLRLIDHGNRRDRKSVV